MFDLLKNHFLNKKKGTLNYINDIAITICTIVSSRTVDTLSWLFLQV